MDFILDGFFGIKIDASDPVIGGIIVALLGVMLIIQAIIGVVSFWHIRRAKKLKRRFKILYYGTVFLAILATLTMIFHNMVVIVYHYTALIAVLVASIWYCTMLYFPLSLLIFLVMRLHVTFDNTVFELSQTSYTIFAVILVTLFIIPLSIPLIFVLSHDLKDDDYKLDVDMYPPWFLIAFFVIYTVYFMIYAAGSGLAVYHFVHTLRELAKTHHEHADSPTSSSETELPPKEVTLNKHQQKASDLAARYLLLFGVALASDGLCHTLGYAFSLTSIRSLFFVANIVVNLLCVYLQFGFAEHHYNGYCGCLDEPARRKLSRSTSRYITRSMSRTPVELSVGIVVRTPSVGDHPSNTSQVTMSMVNSEDGMSE